MRIRSGGGVAVDVWREMPHKTARRLVRRDRAKFVKYTGSDGFAARSLTPDRTSLPGCISQLPGKGSRYYRHLRSLTFDAHNDTKQALIGRYVYWLCTSVNSEPVHHVRFECTTYNGTETTTVSSEGNDTFEKFWTIFTAVHTFTANDTVNRIHLENVGDVEYAEYPNDGNPDLAQAVNDTDVLTINWKREVNGTPNSSTKAGQELPDRLNRALQSAHNVKLITDMISISYDAGANWNSAAATKVAGGALTDNDVQFEAEIAAHGEGTEQTIDRSALHNPAVNPTLVTSTCWNGAASEAWPVGQSKIVDWKITITDYVAGETV